MCPTSINNYVRVRSWCDSLPVINACTCCTKKKKILKKKDTAWGVAKWSMKIFKFIWLQPIGSLSNDDNDSRKNGNKLTGLDWQNNIFARASHFFVHFFAWTLLMYLSLVPHSLQKTTSKLVNIIDFFLCVFCIQVVWRYFLATLQKIISYLKLYSIG